MDRTDLHAYQQRMVEFVKDTPCCALFAECGTGKSITTLTAISDLVESMDVQKVLIIAPKFVAATTWTDECAKWGHLKSLRVVRVMGNEKERIEALQKTADIYVLGRDSLIWLVKYFKAKIPFDMAVLDELTTFKNTKSLRFKAFRMIRSQLDRIVGLTGTPAPNGYLDLFGQIYCIDGGQRLGKFITHYKEMYFNQIMARGGNYAIKCDLRKGAKEQIDKKISEIAMVMKAGDYLSLPERTDIIQHIELSEPLMKKYHEFERELVLSMKDGDVTASSAATLVNKLSQFTNGAIYDDDRNVIHIHDEKIEACKEIYEQAGGHVLIFYRYKHDVPRLFEAFGNNEKKSPRIRKFEKDSDVQDWNQGNVDILLAHPASTGYGLNLQRGGNVVIWLNSGWDLEQYQQANARLYRQGQKNRVFIYNLVCMNTVDVRAMMALQNKGNAQESLMDAVKELFNKYKL